MTESVLESVRSDAGGSFVTDSLTYKIVGLKGKPQQHYVTGYIITEDVDTANELVVRGAILDMVEQLKSGSIKLDIEHEYFRKGAVEDYGTKTPLGRIIDARVEDTPKGAMLWVKAVLNKNHDRFEKTWAEIQEGYLDAFSIAYHIVEADNQIVEGKSVRVLRKVHLLNVALTGVPVNKGARMLESFLKSLGSSNSEVKLMAEEQVETDVVAELKSIAEKQAEMVEALKAELKSVRDEVAELKSASAEGDDDEDDGKEFAELKSLVEAQNSTIEKVSAELKSASEKVEALEKTLEKPVLKSRQPAEAVSDDEDTRFSKAPLSLIK
jgi:HK97 family phage prohead protease